MFIQYLQTFIAGLFISLSGSLPLGNLNVAAMQIASGETLRKALWFAIGVTIVEMLYLAITLKLVGRIDPHTPLFRFFRILAVLLLLIMAVGSFRATMNKEGKNIVIDNKARRLFLGATMSAVNPMQIPFWMGWVVYLLSESLINNSLAGNAVFTLSAGIGTFSALLIFIVAGRRFSKWMRQNTKLVNLSMGCLFTLMALFQIIHLL